MTIPGGPNDDGTGGGGGFGGLGNAAKLAGGPAGMALGAVTGGFGNFLNQRQQKRNTLNDMSGTVAQDKHFNPNRSVNAALQRNLAGGLLKDIIGGGGEKTAGEAIGDVAGFAPGQFQSMFNTFKNVIAPGGGFAGRVKRALQGGAIDPRLLQELGNIEGVDNLEVGGKAIGKTSKERLEAALETPGFLESFASGALGSLF